MAIAAGEVANPLDSKAPLRTPTCAGAGTALASFAACINGAATNAVAYRYP